MSGPTVALLTYSTKPRGGVAHTLALAEALYALGVRVQIVGLGDPSVGFYRQVAAPVVIIPGPGSDGSLEDRVAASIDLLAAGLTDVDADIFHAQDCISARAGARVRDSGAPITVVRTVHHVDDFTSQVLIDCQRAAILEPDVLLVVSDAWRRILDAEYGVAASVVPNGVDADRFGSGSVARAGVLRRQVGAEQRPLLLTVGGIEPRKGSDTLVNAVAALSRSRSDRPVLAVIGGHSFQDYRDYRQRVLASIPDLGLALDDDIVLVGTVPDKDLPAWYKAADVFVFPSVKEGFGLVVLEAMSARLPVVTSDLPVFREYLVPGRDALLAPVGDAPALADAIGMALDNPVVRARLINNGQAVAHRYSWPVSARRHVEVYDHAARVLSDSQKGTLP